MFNLQFSHVNQILAEGNYSALLKVSQFCKQVFYQKKGISKQVVTLSLSFNLLPCLANALMPSNFSQASVWAVSATGMSRFFARARSRLRLADS